MRPDPIAELLRLMDERAAEVVRRPSAHLATMTSASTAALDEGPTVDVVIPPGVVLAVGRRVLCVPIQGTNDFVVVGQEPLT